MSAWIEITPCYHVLSPQSLKQVVSADAADTLIDLNYDLLIIGLIFLLEAQQSYSWNARQFALVFLKVASIHSDRVTEAFEARQSHDC